MKPLEDCLRILVSCACGDGNLALNTGPQPDGTIDLEEEANTATARQDWDAAIALLREAVENGASSNLAAVRNKLASLLFSRAVRNTKRAVAMLGAVASHRKMMAEMTDKLKRHHGDHCAMCGKSRSIEKPR